MSLYRIPNTRQIVIDGSCASQGGQIYTNVYEWDNSFKNWCLRREVTGEKPYLNSGEVAPKEDVVRVEGCSEPGDLKAHQYMPPAQSKEAVIGQLRHFQRIKKDGAATEDFIKSLPAYSVAELVPYIDATTAEDINDIAFFLSKYNRSYDAIVLLEPIVNKFPERYVAKLNLADAYWSNGFNDSAIPLYVAYEAKMKSLGLLKKIPSRVKDRQAANRSLIGK
ncbi:hypothetical protein [Caballeronia sp. LZ001]|uniref:hypothetical protein n=1 Tax=Caballeronia sp. LZ001 TaxID=3038553 RepID=UPI00285E19A5|nr:hypothetical protein [Caballeronia sp. LZ001]MDR5799559.1 hypothetical protein [Caballeronia sp. LZ001]